MENNIYTIPNDIQKIYCIEGHTKKLTRDSLIHMHIFSSQDENFAFVGEEQDQLQASTATPEAPPKKQRKKPTCPKCGNPKKGHKAALCKDQN